MTTVNRMEQVHQAFAEYQRQFNERGEIRIVGESAAWLLNLLSEKGHMREGPRGDVTAVNLQAAATEGREGVVGSGEDLNRVLPAPASAFPPDKEQTPRTDTFCTTIPYGVNSGAFGKVVEFARQLERELAIAKDDLEVQCRAWWEAASPYATPKALREALSARGPKLPSLPHDIQEWCWHMDLHLTEHDERHAAIALRSAWPHVSKWLQENVAPSQGGTPYVGEKK